MSGIGSSEFILLLVIGLIVLGPKRLPEIANRIGSWIGQARRMTRVMKRQLEEELNFDQHKKLLPPTPPFASTASDPKRDPEPAPPPLAAETDPELNPDPPPEHIPNDDDTYSPLHDESAEPAAEAPEDQARDAPGRARDADG
ncbi:MAG: Sec-independent protein translocase protein TatB [Woeseiaceae bacterium]|nr:Sec-independent protein translocase protein TatB [Woeseiaceae bacterium]